MKQQESYNFFEEEKYLRAKKRLKQVTGFYWHLFWYLFINIGVLVFIYSKLSPGEPLHIANYSMPLFWGIGLLGHWFAIFGKNILFSKSWEERKIREFMNKDKP